MTNSKEWTIIPGLNDFYEIRTNPESNREIQVRSWKPRNGRGTRSKEPRILPGRLDNRDSRKYYGLRCPEGTMRTLQAGTWFLLTFDPDGYFAGAQCRHLDGDCTNDHANNLCWGTPMENQRDSILHGTKAAGSKHGNAKLTEDVVLAIRASELSTSVLATQFGVSYKTIYDARTGRRWKFL